MRKLWERRAPRVALVLGSGAARGWAHIGVVQELLAAGCRIDMVAGASMGALVGAVFAAGRMEGLRDLACRLDWRQMISYFIELNFPRSGLIDGRKVVEFTRRYVKFARIEELPLPFRAVATDIISGSEFVFERGDVVEAVRASIAIPAMFTPVCLDGKILADGGLVNPVPVSVARAMGADFVIAVDVNHYFSAATAAPPLPGAQACKRRMAGAELDLLAEIVSQVKKRLAGADTALGRTINRWTKAAAVPGIFDVLGNSIRIMEARITEAELRANPPELLIRPQLGGISFMDFHRAAEIIRAGRQATRELLNQKSLPDGVCRAG